MTEEMPPLLYPQCSAFWKIPRAPRAIPYISVPRQIPLSLPPLFRRTRWQQKQGLFEDNDSSCDGGLDDQHHFDDDNSEDDQDQDETKKENNETLDHAANWSLDLSDDEYIHPDPKPRQGPRSATVA